MITNKREMWLALSLESTKKILIMNIASHFFGSEINSSHIPHHLKILKSSQDVCPTDSFWSAIFSPPF